MNFSMITLNRNLLFRFNLLFNTDTDNFTIYIKTEYFYRDITNNVEEWFDTFNYDKNDKILFLIGKNKNVIGLLKDE